MEIIRGIRSPQGRNQPDTTSESSRVSTPHPGEWKIAEASPTSGVDTSSQETNKLGIVAEHPPTLSIVVGDKRCNARCAFCAPKMVGLGEVIERRALRERHLFEAGLERAKELGVHTVQITSEGEPTLFPEQITEYLQVLEPLGFSSTELQTNGLKLVSDPAYRAHLETWRELGLSTIAVSIVHYEPEKNRAIYLPSAPRYPDLSVLANTLHEVGFRIRLSCTLLKGYIDSPSEVAALIDFARELHIEEINVRSVRVPSGAEENSRTAWVRRHSLTEQEMDAIEYQIQESGVRIAELPHGASLFDLQGLQVCVSRGSSENRTSSSVARLILLPNGRLETDWP